MKHFLPATLLLLSGFYYVACSSVETGQGVAQRMTEAMAEADLQAPGQFRAVADPGSIQVNWLDSFRSRQLDSLVDEAQANNRDLQAAAAEMERARALAGKAGASLKPSLAAGASGGGGGLLEGAATEDFGLGAQVSWELDIWGKLAAGKRKAEASAEAAEAQFKYARHAIAATTAKAYFIALEASLQEELAQENIQTLEDVARIVQVQYDNGMANAQDLALSKSDLAFARSQIEEVRLARRDALRALELLLGRYPGADIELAKTMPRLPAPPPAGVPSELLERRPDIVAAERQVAAAFEETARTRAARLPSLSLTGNLGGSSPDLSSLLNRAHVVDNILVLKAAHDMYDGIDFPDVGEELVTQAFSFAGAFDQAGDIDKLYRGRDDLIGLGNRPQGFQPGIRHLNDAHVRVDRAKWIICRFGLTRARKGVEERALANIRETYDTCLKHSGQKMQGHASCAMKKQRPMFDSFWSGMLEFRL